MDPSTLAKIKILLVEDEEMIRELLVRKLDRNGFEVIIAEDGSRVIELARAHRPDMIGLDILMPGINGYEVLDILGRDTELSSIPVVILSNLGQDDEVARCKAKGAIDFIVKANFTPSEMVAKLRALYSSLHDDKTVLPPVAP